jgi:mannose-6-phosphate isomerase-like protein (cupin superfamily)
MTDRPFPLRLTPAEAAALPLSPGRLSAQAGEANGIEVRHYAPRGTDPQTPHDRDELYVIISGSGSFSCGEHRTPFAPGDLLHVAAHVPHRFESFSDDFACWVVFYGPRRAGAGQP